MMAEGTRPLCAPMRRFECLSSAATIFHVMTADVWQPMSAREAGTTGLREGVPPVMEGPLRDWIRKAALGNPTVERVRIRANILWGASDKAEWDRLADETMADDLLDVADALLDLLPRPDGKNPVLDQG
jgi:hypothetical protein